MKKYREVPTAPGPGSADEDVEAWVGREVQGCQFADIRHRKRLRQLLLQFSNRVGAATPWAFQDWAAVKAAYRFLSNERVSESGILAGHFLATRSRIPKNSYLLDEVIPNKPHQVQQSPLAHYVIKLARLGGYLARAHDPPPGNTVVWRGMSRLTDIELGIMIGVELVGN